MTSFDQTANPRWRAILDALPDLLFHIGSDGTVIDLHGALGDLLMPPEEVLGARFIDFLDSSRIVTAVQPEAADAFRTAFADRQPAVLEYAAPNQQYYEARLLPVEDTEEFIIMVRNISERRRTEAALQASEERYRSLVESADSSIVLFDLSGKVLYANAIAAGSLGQSPESMVGKSQWELFPPEVAEYQMGVIREVITSGIGVVVEAPGSLMGEERWFRTSVQPVRDAAGQITAALINATDITRVKRSETVLRSSADALRQQQRFLEILLGLSSRFINLPPESLEAELARTLAEVGSFLNADRVYIFDYDFERMITRNTHEWCADGIEPQIANLQEVPLQGLEAWYLPHQRGELVSIPDVNALPVDSALRQILEPQGIKSLLVIPLMADGECMGIVGLDSVHDYHQYSDVEHQLLQVLAELLVNVRVRVKTLSALRDSEERYRTVSELISDYAYSYRVEADGQLVHEWVTPSYTRITGYDAGEAGYRGRYTIYAPEDQARAAADVQETLRGETTTGEYQFITKQGERRWLQISRQPVLDETGQRVVRIYGAATDITGRKRAEEALQEANRTLEARVAARTAELEEERNLLRTVIDTVPDFIYVKDRQHRMLLNNIAHARSLGVRGEIDTLGKTDLELFPPELAAKFYADEARVFESKQPVMNTEERSIGTDGQPIWALTTKAPLRNLRGEVIGLVGITRNITSIKASAEALRASEERYRATIAAMSEGIVVQGMDGAIQLCNAAAERILGLTVDQMVGRTSVDPRWRAIHEDGSPFPGETHPAMVVLRTGEAQSDVVMGVHKPDGALTWILINAQPLLSPGDLQPYAVVTTFADITTRKQAEQALRQALDQEKELGELKSRFVTLASHEFRTPLAAILATTETLSHYWERLDKPKIDDRLGRIRGQVAHMTSIMEDVLELARMQAGRVKYDPAPGDLDALCRSIMAEYEDQADQERRLTYECARSPMPAVFDARMMRQVIGNLVQNALKYSPADKPVRVTLAEEEYHLILRVQDEGIGIPPEDMKRLFEPFHRAGNVGAISGTGLGLSIARQAVELHGGRITAESTLNRGATFTIRLPKTT